MTQQPKPETTMNMQKLSQIKEQVTIRPVANFELVREELTSEAFEEIMDRLDPRTHAQLKAGKGNAEKWMAMAEGRAQQKAQSAENYSVTIRPSGAWTNIDIISDGGLSQRAKYSGSYGYNLREQRWARGEAPTGEHALALRFALEQI